ESDVHRNERRSLQPGQLTRVSSVTDVPQVPPLHHDHRRYYVNSQPEVAADAEHHKAGSFGPVPPESVWVSGSGKTGGPVYAVLVRTTSGEALSVQELVWLSKYLLRGGERGHICSRRAGTPDCKDRGCSKANRIATA